MRHLDATELYDLSEAGKALLRDPARLRREIRLGRIPAVWLPDGAEAASWALPVAWVDAESGESALDPEALRTYWLERFQPPSAAGARPAKAREAVEGRALLPREEAARRLFCDAKALLRLERDGTLVTLRIEDEVRHDEALVDALAGEAVDPATLDAMRAELKELARFDYVQADDAAPVSVPWRKPDPKPADAQAPRSRPEAAAPRAYQIPDALFEAGEAAEGGSAETEPTRREGPPQGDGLIQADGYDVIDEED